MCVRICTPRATTCRIMGRTMGQVETPERQVRQIDDSVKTVTAASMETVREIQPVAPPAPVAATGHSEPHVIASKPKCSLEDTQSPVTGWIGFIVYICFMSLTAAIRQPPEFLTAIWPWRCTIMLLTIALAMV